MHMRPRFRLPRGRMEAPSVQKNFLLIRNLQQTAGFPHHDGSPLFCQNSLFTQGVKYLGHGHDVQ